MLVNGQEGDALPHQEARKGFFKTSALSFLLEEFQLAATSKVFPAKDRNELEVFRERDQQVCKLCVWRGPEGGARKEAQLSTRWGS